MAGTPNKDCIVEFPGLQSTECQAEMRQPLTGVKSRSVFACAGKIFEEKKVSLNFGVILQHHTVSLWWAGEW